MRIRSAPMYALVKEQSAIQIRDAVVYVLAKDPPMIPDIEPKLALEKLMYKLTDYPFQEGELVIGEPEAVNEFDRNTRVLVSTTNPEVEGTMYFYYNRVPVERLNIVGEFYLKDEVDMAALFPRLNAYAGPPLKESDFVNTPRINNTIEVIASATGHLFLPGSKITIYPAP